MENMEETSAAQVVAVKPEEIQNLGDLGFQEDADLMVLETETGIVGVDKETGVVATQSDGASVEELAIVSELVASGVAEVTTADAADANTAKTEVANTEPASTAEPELKE